ncbi:MAG: tRNA uridine-5-carboxymethylaminomethyl(34) synthesis GTPase MnmE [Pseudomonadota bacterium]
MTDTIFAPATAQGRAGVAIIRLSGPDAAAALTALTGRPPPAPRFAARATYRDAKGDLLDHGLALYFPAPASFTGEDVVELHLHGGRAVSAAIMDALGALPRLRPAEPGEFSKRAFLNGKLDLTKAEAIADLVDAETRAQQRQALRQLDGALGLLYEAWAHDLVHALAHLEADLDFPDEDLPHGVADQTRPTLRRTLDEITKHLSDNRRGERLRSGVEVAILGAPNAGKSSLLNALARRDAAIVSDIAGTTRDVIEVHLDLKGFPVVLADTAGLRETADRIEDEGVRRALARAERADLKLLLYDGALWPAKDATTADLRDGDAIEIVAKADLLPATDDLPLAISTVTGAGLDDLLDRLAEAVASRLAGSGPALTRARHRAALEDAKAALDRAMTAHSPELVAEDVRLSVRAIGRITGRVDVEDLLDVVFRDFCIGK